jgi:hypothetical protein
MRHERAEALSDLRTLTDCGGRERLARGDVTQMQLIHKCDSKNDLARTLTVRTLRQLLIDVSANWDLETAMNRQKGAARARRLGRRQQS